MFHVKHSDSPRSQSPSTSLWKNAGHPFASKYIMTLPIPRVIPGTSLPNAEVPENHVENVLNIDATGEAPQGTCCEPQFLSKQIFAARQVRRQGATQGRPCILQSQAVPLARYQGALGASQKTLGVLRQGVQQRVEAFAGLG